MLNQVLGNEAEWSLMVARPPEARVALDAARASLKKQYGEKLNNTEAWRSAVLDVTEAACDLQEQQYPRAETLLLGALSTLERRFGPRGFYVDRTNSRLVQLYTLLGQAARAEPYRSSLAGTPH